MFGELARRQFAYKISSVAAMAVVLGFSAVPLPVAAASIDTAGTANRAGEAKPAQRSAEDQVKGFRSAHFGMSEAEVRAAIVKDFGVRAEDMKASINPYERTHLLTIRVPDVLPGGGAADVVYTFGFKSKKLVQIGLLWSKSTDKAITADRLVESGNILRNHLAESGYKPDTVTSNVGTKSGLLLFRGEDGEGHVTVLMLQGTMTAEDKGKSVLTPLALTLFYLADAKHPDIFKLGRGSF